MAQIARGPGIVDTTLHHWCKLFGEHETHVFPGSGHQLPQEEEHRKLRCGLEVVFRGSLHVQHERVTDYMSYFFSNCCANHHHFDSWVVVKSPRYGAGGMTKVLNESAGRVGAIILLSITRRTGISSQRSFCITTTTHGVVWLVTTHVTSLASPCSNCCIRMLLAVSTAGVIWPKGNVPDTCYYMVQSTKIEATSRSSTGFSDRILLLISEAFPDSTSIAQIWRVL